MSLVIIAPMPGDTVINPVLVTTAYEFTSGNFTITTTLTGAMAATSGSVTGLGSFSANMATTATGPVTAASSCSPSSGGAENSVSFTIGTSSNPPPIIIETVLPSSPPPPPPMQGARANYPVPAAAGKKFNIKGKIKNSPNIKSVRYRIMQVDLTTLQWTVAVDYKKIPLNGNNWHDNDVPLTPQAHCQYTVQADALDASDNSLGQFSMGVKLP